MYTSQDKVLSAPRIERNLVLKHIREMDSPYTEESRVLIFTEYYQLCVQYGIDPLFVTAQVLLETNNLNSFWSQRPQRNPAGLGVTGQFSRQPRPGFVFNTQRMRYEEGLSFTHWVGRGGSVRAHVGRLLAYTQKDTNDLILEALNVRSLPNTLRGSVTIIKEFSATHNKTKRSWATDPDYGEKIVALMNRIKVY